MSIQTLDLETRSLFFELFLHFAQPVHDRVVDERGPRQVEPNPSFALEGFKPLLEADPGREHRRVAYRDGGSILGTLDVGPKPEQRGDRHAVHEVDEDLDQDPDPDPYEQVRGQHSDDRGYEDDELLAAHVRGAPLPAYAGAFHPARFDDPGYLDAFASEGADGQL